VTHLSVITNPSAARADADHIIVVPPDDYIIEVPPPGPDDCVVALPDGRRFWVSLPPEVRAWLPHDRARDVLELLSPSKQCRRPRKLRRPTLASVAKQARKAAIAVARYEVKPDGSIIVVTTEGEPIEASNPWLVDLSKVRR
jgi:hypothetical protein